VESLVTVVSAILILLCEQMHTDRRADERYTPATLVGMSSDTSNFR